MERKRISNAKIRSVGYDAKQQVLEIEFSSGDIVQYSRVSEEYHRRMMAAPNPYSYFQDKIEEGFSSRRVR